jgi:prepilin-type processing-associated H-X9-DG protein
MVHSGQNLLNILFLDLHAIAYELATVLYELLDEKGQCVIR